MYLAEAKPFAVSTGHDCVVPFHWKYSLESGKASAFWWNQKSIALLAIRKENGPAGAGFAAGGRLLRVGAAPRLPQLQHTTEPKSGRQWTWIRRSLWIAM
jgi:hypothetical protein